MILTYTSMWQECISVIWYIQRRRCSYPPCFYFKHSSKSEATFLSKKSSPYKHTHTHIHFAYNKYKMCMMIKRRRKREREKCRDEFGIDANHKKQGMSDEIWRGIKWKIITTTATTTTTMMITHDTLRYPFFLSLTR